MQNYIIKDIISVLPYMKLSLIVALSFTMIQLIYQYIVKHRLRLDRLLLYYLFVTYIGTTIEVALLSREPGSRTKSDLELFSTWGDTARSHAYVIENVIMFIPLGILLPLIVKKTRKCYILFIVSFLCSLGIETTQHITGRGYFQTDDIVTNVIGAVVGYIMIMIVLALGHMIFRRQKQSNK